jgi:dihydropteroate synthase
MIWRVRDSEIALGGRTLVMGILNVTPDSFSDGGQLRDCEAAVTRAKEMLAEGADIVDVGGESSRPGAEAVPVEEELRRVIPVLERLHGETGALISIDTTKSAVARKAIAAGASIINDISALRFDEGMAGLAAETKVGVVLMHMQGTPRDMQKDPKYGDVVKDISEFLTARRTAAVGSGVRDEALVFDPGIGFGKTYENNLEIMARLKEFRALGRPLLVGPSRKAFIGKALGDLPPEDRGEGTAAVVALAIGEGADIVRVHDVKAMRRVALVADAVARLA